MVRWACLAAALALLSAAPAGAWQAGKVPAGDPPDEGKVLRTLPKLPRAGFTEIFRDDISVVSEEVRPGHWKCTVHYKETLQLRWLNVRLKPTNRVEIVYLTRQLFA
jgi:hypothetical protein